MRSRQFVCNDSRVIALLDRFTPVVDSPNNYEGWNVKVDRTRLQFRLVDQILRQTPYGRIVGAQGLYIVTPSGLLLAGTTEHSNAARVLAEMRRGLEAYRRLPKTERLLPHAPDEAKDRLDLSKEESKPPANGLVLRMVTRGLGDSSVSANDTRHGKFYKLDRVWLTREQARAFVPARVRVGEKASVKGSGLQIIAQLHLGVFIQPNPAWNTEDVKQMDLTSEITSVDGDEVEVSFNGEARFAAANPHNNRRYAPRLLGHATYNVRIRQFDKFEFVAVGIHTLGDRGEDARASGPKSIPLGVLFTLNGANANDQVAPEYHSRYDAISRSGRG